MPSPSNAHPTAPDPTAARAVWAAYRVAHDLSQQAGRTAGIDPATGRVWIGDSIPAVVARRDADGVDAPLWFERIGSATYYRKGSRAESP